MNGSGGSLHRYHSGPAQQVPYQGMQQGMQQGGPPVLQPGMQQGMPQQMGMPRSQGISAGMAQAGMGAPVQNNYQPNHYQQNYDYPHTLRPPQRPRTPRQVSGQSSHSYGLVNSPGLRQAASPTSPNRRVSLNSMIGLPEDAPVETHNPINIDDIDTDSNHGKVDSGELVTLEKEVKELREKNQEYYYDLTKLRTDSSRRQELNTQLLQFIAQMISKMPDYITQKDSFEELIGSVTLPQSARQSYKKALAVYDESEVSTDTPATPNIGAGEQLLSDKQILEMFRSEVKLLNAKVQRVEGEKARIESLLRERIENERNAVRRIAKMRASEKPTESVRPRGFTFKLIDVVEPEIKFEDGKVIDPDEPD